MRILMFVYFLLIVPLSWGGEDIDSWNELSDGGYSAVIEVVQNGYRNTLLATQLGPNKLVANQIGNSNYLYTAQLNHGYGANSIHVEQGNRNIGYVLQVGTNLTAEMIQGNYNVAAIVQFGANERSGPARIIQGNNQNNAIFQAGDTICRGITL